MTNEEMEAFIGGRIETISALEVNPALANTNGLLLHLIPEHFNNNNPINWNDPDRQFKIKHAFRNFNGLDTVYSDQGHILGYTPNNKYFILNQTGIIEVFVNPIVIDNQFNNNLNYIIIDNVFISVHNFIEASKAVHRIIYSSLPPYYIYVSLLGIQGDYFLSRNHNYQTLNPFPAENGRFDQFSLNNLNDNIMREIIATINSGNKASPWQKIF